MVDAELKPIIIKKEENDPVEKEVVDTFNFDKELYLREIKNENNLLNEIKNEEDTLQYDNTNYNVNYEDFQLTNEEISIKTESFGTNG